MPFVLKTYLASTVSGLVASKIRHQIYSVISNCNKFGPEEPVTGLNFGIGKYSIDLNDHEDEKITLQLWNIHDCERFRFILPTYMTGSKIGIFISFFPHLQILHETINRFMELTEYCSIGTVMAVPEEYTGHDDLIRSEIEDIIGMPVIFANSIQELVEWEIKDSYRQFSNQTNDKEGIHIFLIPGNYSITERDYIHVPTGPVIWKEMRRVEEPPEFLLKWLDNLDVPVKENRFAFIFDEDFLWKIDLWEGKVRVAPKSCWDCKHFPCRKSPEHVCIVYGTTFKREFSLKDPFLTSNHLLALSIIWAIENNCLPNSVREKLTKRSPCTR